ncbi:MAG TPA: hypothetical protein VF372_01495, partial [Thermodesulfobacteriota bacterium]
MGEESIFTLSACFYKSETRSTKFETNPKFEKANLKLPFFEHSNFVHCRWFRPAFRGIRNSDFEFTRRSLLFGISTFHFLAGYRR